jgi:hypothetical protein
VLSYAAKAAPRAAAIENILHLHLGFRSNVDLAVQPLEELAMTNSPQNNDRNKNQAGQQQGGQGQGQPNQGQQNQGNNNPGQNHQSGGGRQSGTDSDRMNRKDGSKEGSK